MSIGLNGGYVTRVLFFVFSFSTSLYWCENVHGLMIESSNVQGIAIYGQSSNFGEGLKPNQLIFNVTNSSTISSMISSIEFSEERDCSTLGARTNAYVYIKFNDNSIEVYDLFGMYSHLSKVGLRGSCHYVSEQGQSLFENNAQ